MKVWNVTARFLFIKGRGNWLPCQGHFLFLCQMFGMLPKSCQHHPVLQSKAGHARMVEALYQQTFSERDQSKHPYSKKLYQIPTAKYICLNTESTLHKHSKSVLLETP